jgi:hypothetical protein
MTDDNEEHLSKQLSPRYFTDFGIMSVDNDEHS